MANSLRCDRLAIQQAAAPSPAPSGASEDSPSEQELADEEEAGQRSVSVSLPPSPDEPPPPTEGSPQKVRRRCEALGSLKNSNHAAEEKEGDRPAES